MMRRAECEPGKLATVAMPSGPALVRIVQVERYGLVRVQHTGDLAEFTTLHEPRCLRPVETVEADR